MIVQTVLDALRGGRARPAPPDLRLLHFPGIRRPVLLQNAPEVEQGLAIALNGWTPHALDPALLDNPDTPAPMSDIIRDGDGDGFDLHSAFLETRLGVMPAASAVCSAIADLAQGFFEERPGCLALHCGAIRFNDRLIAFAGHARAGKSTLTARLTAEPDMQVFCDDVLPVLDDGLAFGLGIAPRLRLPLPASASPAFRAHVARHMRLCDDRYGYVSAPTVAPHGTRAALSAFVVLSRIDDAPAQLHRMEPAEAVEHLLAQNMADPGTGSRVFDTVTAMAADLLCVKLVYSELEDAVCLIRAAFGGDALPDPRVTLHPALARAEIVPDLAPPADLARHWQRSPDVALRRLEGDAFLWHLDHRGAFRLNPVAAAVWTLLEDPATGQDLAAILAEAFPAEPEERIRNDLAALLGALAAQQLIRSA